MQPMILCFKQCAEFFTNELACIRQFSSFIVSDLAVQISPQAL